MFECQYTFVKTKAHEISIFPTHNLEVPGSSPGWSTKKIKQLQNLVTAFFFICVNKLFELEDNT